MYISSFEVHSGYTCQFCLITLNYVKFLLLRQLPDR
jgi:hypothetical protein